MVIPRHKETISVNGIDMYYEIYGEGSPLLILHGFSGSGAGLAALFNDLTKSHQLIIPDLRGHGRSTNSLNEYTFLQSALDVFALLDHLNIKHCSAIGFSGGGCNLLHMAYEQPERIKSMAIVSAAPYFPQSTRELMQLVTVENRTNEDWNAMRKIHLHGDEQIKMIWKQANAFSQNQDMNFTSEKLAKIKAKTLVIQGDRDPFYPLDITIEMYKGLPDAYLWIVANGGHGPLTSREDIQEFIHKFNNFMHWGETI